jgi:hypothetical protein
MKTCSGNSGRVSCASEEKALQKLKQVLACVVDTIV